MASMRQSSLADLCREGAGDQSLDQNLSSHGDCAEDRTRSESPGSILIKTIENDIIPRLVLAHSTEGTPCTAAGLDPAAPSGTRHPDAADIEAFTVLVLEADVALAADFVTQMLDDGVSIDAIFMDLFAGTARHLGDLWVADLRDFTEVTIGVGRLQQLLREFAGPYLAHGDQWVLGRRALLAPAPGEQHTFGMLLVGEYLRRAGWDVTGEPSASRQSLCGLVGGEWFAMVGLSLSSEAQLKSLSKDIRAIRQASQNDHVGVLVGGKVFDENPDYVARVGADGTAGDGVQAAEVAEEFLTTRCRPANGT